MSEIVMPDSKCMWMRLINWAVISVFAFFVLSMFRKKKEGEKELRDHSEQLERLVEERNAEMMTAINFLTEEIEVRKQNEERLKENEARIRHLHGMKILGELAVGVAHEVRNPLHALISVSEALSKDLKDNPDFEIYLVHIRKQVERLSVLMRDLLDLGKPTEPSHMREESLSDICLASIDLWKNSLSRRGHTVSFVSSFSDKVIVIGDSQRLQQVFLNLLENAANHSPDGREIKVVMSGPEEGNLRVKVIDNGAGIPEANLPRIFEPFFTTRKGGTGLGLSIIKNIIEGHNGSLSVRNNHPLSGCIAEVVLPLARGTEQ
jgi:two-component system NtrC family sensor kinase